MTWLRKSFISLAVFFFLSPALFSEVCYEDEEHLELEEIFDKLETALIEQEQQIEQQQTQLAIAQSSQEISDREIQLLKTSLREAERSYRRQKIVVAIVAGSIGAGAGILFIFAFGGPG